MMTGRRGVTFLEVALSVALLASVAAIIAGSYDGISRISDRQQHRLNATEVAHRLILNYLLDPKSLPDPGQNIPYGEDQLYRHELIEEMLIEEDPPDENVALRTPMHERRLTDNERLGAGLKMITVKVYHTRERGRADASSPLASVSRIYSPIDPSRDEDILLRQIEHLLGAPVELPSDAPGTNRRR